MPPPRKPQLKMLLAASETLIAGESIIIDAPQSYINALVGRHGLKTRCQSVIVVDDYTTDYPKSTKQTRVIFL